MLRPSAALPLCLRCSTEPAAAKVLPSGADLILHVGQKPTAHAISSSSSSVQPTLPTRSSGARCSGACAPHPAQHLSPQVQRAARRTRPHASRRGSSSNRRRLRRAAAAMASDAQPLSYYIDKIRAGDAATWDKDELLDVIYWWRQVAGIVFGIAWGVGAVTGIVGVVGFLALNVLITIGLYKSLLGIDEEDYGGHPELAMEGMPSCFASFLLSWVITYTALHQPA